MGKLFQYKKFFHYCFSNVCEHFVVENDSAFRIKTFHYFHVCLHRKSISLNQGQTKFLPFQGVIMAVKQFKTPSL
ncbi:hypothetical protein BpHYR1_041258 [Brachionus plicatilis]|uniref:Uncharacterized protein n=1 Tax=Brachionus plicatilis TaxID=10195 RepID=A0A3M7PDP1_BRAPC|nr:hypothetical protein BpHYR1_041258 [Brachionus plicatilis]